MASSIIENSSITHKESQKKHTHGQFLHLLRLYLILIQSPLLQASVDRPVRAQKAQMFYLGR